MNRGVEYDRAVVTDEGNLGNWTQNILDGINRDSEMISIGYINHPLLGRTSIDIPWKSLYGRNLLVSGATGYGKSGLIQNILYQLAVDGRGFAYVDTKGDASQKLLNILPDSRKDDVVVIGQSRSGNIRGFDLLDQKNELSSQVVETTLKNLLKSETYWGPKMDYLFTAFVHTAVVNNYSYQNFLELLDNPETVSDVDIPNEEEHILETIQEFNEHDPEVIDSLYRRARLLGGQELTSLFSDSRSMERIVDDDSIIIVRPNFLSSTGEQSIMIGAFSQMFWELIKYRGGFDDSFFLIFDEIDFVMNETVPMKDMLSQSRSLNFGIGAVLQQFDSVESDIRRNLIGNTENILLFSQTDTNTANNLISGFDQFGRNDVMSLDRFTAATRLRGKYGVWEGELHTFPPIS